MARKEIYQPVNVDLDHHVYALDLVKEGKGCGNLDEAKTLFAKALENDPDNLEAFIAYHEIATKNETKRLEIFKAREDALYRYYMAKGDVKRDLGTFAVVIDHFQYMELLSTVLNLCLKKHLDDEAINYARKMLRLDYIDLYDASYALFALYLKKGMFSQFATLMRQSTKRPSYKTAFKICDAYLRKDEKALSRNVKRLAKQNRALYIVFSGFGDKWNLPYADDRAEPSSIEEASYWMNKYFYPIINYGKKRVHFPVIDGISPLDIFTCREELFTYLGIVELIERREKDGDYAPLFSVYEVWAASRESKILARHDIGLSKEDVEKGLPLLREHGFVFEEKGRYGVRMLYDAISDVLAEASEIVGDVI